MEQKVQIDELSTLLAGNAERMDCRLRFVSMNTQFASTLVLFGTLLFQ